MVRLLPHPLPSVSTSDTQKKKTERDSQFAEGRRGGGGGGGVEEPNHIRTQESMVSYNSFNTLAWRATRKDGSYVEENSRYRHICS
jgi:hypothetical protein